ncbi:Ty3/gypsy retrotransposon protein [Senna tora]|uniref:Ty3/gypsy retrotransposon protein n=1 Tax=Senna tora TaxID=362788 RepID=A0A834SMV7_9FABA|nr:Ty3/gypsy retrotransposon protein [Senna tora]
MTSKTPEAGSCVNHRPMVSNLKFEIPPFDGTDAEFWTFKIKEFFRIAGTPEDQRIGLAALYMTGPASAWYMWMSQNQQISTWDAFLEALLFRFGSTLYDDARGALKQVTQVNTVEEYQAEFEAISTKVTGLSEEWLISFFVFGLKTHLRCEVLLAQPTSYYQAVSLAKLHEQKHNEIQLTYGSPVSKINTVPSVKTFSKFVPNTNSKVSNAIIPVNGNKSMSSYPAKSTVKQASSQGSSNSPNNGAIPAYKRFSAAELKERRALGLCYYCPQKYVRGHKCTPTYYLLIGKEEFDLIMENEADEEAVKNVVVEAVPETTEAVPEISFNALEGQFHPSTIRVTGRYLEHAVQVLIDNGSTLNFIKRSVAEKLKLQMNEIQPFKVQTGNGAFLVCNHQCKQVKFVVQQHVFIVDLFVMDIKGADVVLGVQWLAELGNIVINHKELTMLFQWHGHEVRLQGESMLREVPINGKAIKKMAEENTIACLFSMQKVNEEEAQEKQGVQEEIVKVLEQYQDIFSEPKHLPPEREVDHYINLEPGSKPVSVRPYRGYATVAHPLTELLKKNQFQWNETAAEAFDQLKRMMTQAPVLSLPNFQQQFVVETDASNSGIGAVLSQQGHPIAYFSKKLTSRMTKASTYVRELYAITQAVMKWRHYLLGKKFLIKTDHKSLKELMHQVIQTPDQQFYLSKLLGFEYEIVYRTGKTNMVADALSRKDEYTEVTDDERQLMLLSEVKHEILEAIRRANLDEEELQQLHHAYEQQQLPPSYVVKGDILFFEGRIYVPAREELKKHILQMFHDSVIGASNVDSVDELLKKREELQHQLRENLLKAQRRMQKFADRRRKDVSFQVGSWVLVKLHHYKQGSAAKRLSFKLARRYYGPFKVIEKVGRVAYRLLLPTDSRIHSVFHVSLLKGFKGEPPKEVAVIPNPPQLFETRPAQIVDSRVVEEQGQQVQQVLVEWENRDREEATWEQWETLCQSFPHDNLEDKVIVHGEGIVTISKPKAKPKDNDPMDVGTKAKEDNLDRSYGPNTEAEKSVESARPDAVTVVRAARVRKPPVWLKDYVHNGRS